FVSTPRANRFDTNGAGAVRRPFVSKPPTKPVDTNESENPQNSSPFAADFNCVNSVHCVAGGVDLAHTLYLDFETRNIANNPLDRAGAWCYAGDPHTEILTLVYQNGGGEPRLWVPSDGLSGPLASLAADPTIAVVCFGDFEIAIWQHIMVARYRF